MLGRQPLNWGYMKALKITTIVFFSSLFTLIAWLILQADPMGGEPTHVVTLDRQAIEAEERYRKILNNTDKKNSVDYNKMVDGKYPPLPRVDPSNVKRQITKQLDPKDIAKAMAPVPVKDLIERTRYGQLPKISENGRKSFDVYARPFNLSLAPKSGEPKRIAILITGMGLSALSTHNAIHKLPGQVSLSFGPYGNNLQGWVRKARQLGHEVLLEVPLEPYDYPENDPGPHTLLTSLEREENINRLQWVMGRFAGYVGVTNAMGEKYLTSNDSLLPVFQELHRRGLAYFEDGGGTRSEAAKLARTVGMRFGEADLRIDNVQIEKDIKSKLSRLIEIANQKGFAIGVGSSLPLTIDLLSEWSKTLKQKNIILVPISATMKSYQPS